MKCLDRIFQSVLIAVWIVGGMSIAAIGAAIQTGGEVASSQSVQESSVSPEEKIKTLIVMITAKFMDPDEERFGAGIIFGLGNDRVYIATANHVVRKGPQESQSLRVRFKWLPGEAIEAKLLENSESNLDLAVLAVVGGHGMDLDSLPFHLAASAMDLQSGNPNSLKRGDAVYSIGYPRGQQWRVNVTSDKVSDRSDNTISFESATIGKGHSGGALLNEKWEVVGMITADEPPDGVAVNIWSVIGALRQWGYPVRLGLRGGRVRLTPLPKNPNLENVDGPLLPPGLGKPEKAREDFSTPKAAIETFIAAAVARDLDMLSQCFADNAPGEFDGLRKKTAGKKELDQLAESFQGATVANVVIELNGTTANVEVRRRIRDERIQLIKTVKGWRIVDF
jgi:hypothetical protein